MPIHDHRGGNIPGSYDPNSPVNGAAPPEPTAEQIAAFKAQMADELAAKQAANEKETHESRKIVAREMHHRAVRVDFAENFAIKETALFSGPDGVDKARGGVVIHGVDMQMPVVAHAEIHVHEIPTVDAVRGKTLERHEAGHPAEPGDPGFGVDAQGKPIHLAYDVNAPQDPEVKLQHIAGARVRGVTMPETDPLFVVPGQPMVVENKAVIPPAISLEAGSLDLGTGNRPRRAVVLPEEVKAPDAFGIPEFTGGSRIKPFFQRPAARAVVPEGQNLPQGIPKLPGQEAPYIPVVSAKAETPVVPGEGVRLPFDPAVRVTMPESLGLDSRHTSRFVSDRPFTDIPQQNFAYVPAQKSAYIPPVGEKPIIEGVAEKGPDGIPVANSFAVVSGERAVIPGREIPIIPGQEAAVVPGFDLPVRNNAIIPGIDLPVQIKAVVPGTHPADPFVPVPGQAVDPVNQDPILPDPVIDIGSPETSRFAVHQKSVPVAELPPGAVIPGETIVPGDTRVPGDTIVSLAHAEIHGELPVETPLEIPLEIDPAFEPVVHAVEIPAEEKPREVLRLDPIEIEESEAVAFKPVTHGIEAIPEGNPILAERETASFDVPVVDVSIAVVASADKPLYVGVEIPLDGSNPEDQIRAQQDLAFQGSQPVRFADGVFETNPDAKPVERLVVRAEAGTESRGVDHDRPGEIPLAGEDDAFSVEKADRKRSDRIDDHEDDLPPVFVPGHVNRTESDPILFNVNPGYVPPSRDQHGSNLAYEVVSMVDRFLVTAEQGSYVKEVHMTMNHEILPGTEIQFRQVGNSLVVTFVNMDGGNLELLRREAPDLAESLRTHTGDNVEIRIVTALGGETV